MMASSPFIHFLAMPFVLSFATVSFLAVFNFGDSNSDTGNLVAGVGILLDLPNEQTASCLMVDFFFGRGSGDYSATDFVVLFTRNFLSIRDKSLRVTHRAVED